MKRREAQRAAYRLRHLDDPALASRLDGFLDGYDSAIADATQIQTTWEHERIGKVIGVFDEAEDDTTADEIMQAVFDALGIREAYVGPGQLSRDAGQE